MPEGQEERRRRDSGAPTGFEVALGALGKLDKRKKSILFWFALGMFAFPGVILLIVVIGSLFTTPILPAWVPWILGAMMIVGGLMLMPNRTLKALHAMALGASRLSPKLGKLFSMDRREDKNASQPNDPGAPTP